MKPFTETYLGHLVAIERSEKLDKHSGLNLYNLYVDSKLYGTSPYHKMAELMELAKQQIEWAVESANVKKS